MRKGSRAASWLAAAAAFSMTASPVMARDWGWGGHYRHRDRIDAGDVFAGILIIGGIAAIASAASKANKNRRDDRDYRDRDDYPQRNDQADYRRDSRPEWRENSYQQGSSGIDGAINRCVDEVSRGSTKVDEVDAVNRDGDGWRVEGRTGDGGNFSCSIDREGRIRQVNVEGKAV